MHDAEAIQPDDFAQFYEAVHNRPPFEWQKRFAQEVLTTGWHDVVKVPTACGKTSVLDVAVFELALRAGTDVGVPRRICFVVDRRLVVDDATTHACVLRDAVMAGLSGKRESRVLRVVAKRLASLAAGPGEPLRVVRLRGGVYRDDGWAADHLTPTLMVSTVDQIGSRLLFRGYGVSDRSRPVHAGLLAFDTRIILDEAHLSDVFATTVARLKEYEQWATDPPLPVERLVSIVRMSATARESHMRAFELEEGEREDWRLSSRLQSAKWADLVEVKVTPVSESLRAQNRRKARESERANRAAFVKALVDCVHDCAGRLAALSAELSSNVAPVIGVVVNRVATARHVFNELNRRGSGSDFDAILLTGRIRPHDRDSMLERWLPRMKAGREAAVGRPLFVVATQTVEVGANLDFDALVTEAAPLDSLRQRFGRLDRLGTRHKKALASPAAILIRSDQKSDSERDPIYGQPNAETWKWLIKQAKKKKGVRQIDFGVNALDAKLPQTAGELRPMLASQPDSPALLPAHLDAWVQTNPRPEPDPDTAPFLHGVSDAVADVEIVWRADLGENNSEAWREIVSLMPPRTRECLPVPVYEARAWLRRSAHADIADVEGTRSEYDNPSRTPERSALRWRGADDVIVVGSDDLRPGDTIIVPSSYGGADEFGWNPESRKPVADVADVCLAQLVASYPTNAFRRPKLRVRLHRALFFPTSSDQHERREQLLEGAVAAAKQDGDNPWPTLLRLITMIAGQSSDASYRAGLEAVAASHATSRRIGVYPRSAGVVVSASVPVSLELSTEGPVEMEVPGESHDDESSIGFAGRQVTLDEHQVAVEQRAGDWAGRSGLSDAIQNALKLAGRRHDEGKRDPRFQAWLFGSELQALIALARNEPLAKSGRDPREWRPSEAFGYPRGSRHEFVSVRLFDQMADASADTADLARFLIGTHLGYVRSFAPVHHEPHAGEVSLPVEGRTVTVDSDHKLYLLESGWVDLFWRLVRRYGWWGLAYLEAVLVTSDRAISNEEQTLHAQHSGEKESAR